MLGIILEGGLTTSS